MPATVKWDDEAQTMIYCKIVSPLPWDEFHEVINEGKALIQQVADFRGILVDVREADDIPPSGFINQARQFLQDAPDVPIVMIGDTAIIKAIVAPVSRILRQARQFHFVATIEEGRAIILASNESNST